MSRTLRALFAVLPALALTAGPARGEEPVEDLPRTVAERVKRSTAYVQGKAGHGSGFVVLPGVVATNSHVVRFEVIENVAVRFVDDRGTETQHRVRLLYEDMTRDLAFLQIVGPAPNRPQLPVAANFVPVGRPGVYVVGNPGQVIRGLSLVNSVGAARCEEAPAMLGGQPYIRLTAEDARVPKTERDREAARDDHDPYQRLVRELTRAITVGPGCSGGPVVDRKGAVVGVLTAGLTNGLGRPAGTLFCVPAGAVRAAADAVGPQEAWDEQVRTATAGHYLRQAMALAHVRAEVANFYLATRVELLRQAREPAEFIRADRERIAEYQTLDKELRALAAPAIARVTTGGAVPAERRAELQEVLDLVDSLRGTAQRARFGQPEYEQARTKFRTCRIRLERFGDENGLPIEAVDTLLRQVMPQPQSRHQ